MKNREGKDEERNRERQGRNERDGGHYILRCLCSAYIHPTERRLIASIRQLLKYRLKIQSDLLWYSLKALQANCQNYQLHSI